MDGELVCLVGDADNMEDESQVSLDDNGESTKSRTQAMVSVCIRISS